MTTQILPQISTARNGQHSPKWQVRLTRPARTHATGHILPAGHIGTVLEYNHHINRLMVDFGIANYCTRIDPNSDLIEFVAAGNGK